MAVLSQLSVGDKARIDQVTGSPALMQRLLEMGMLEGEEIVVLGFAPMGDPMEILLRDYRLSLRASEASGILVTKL